ncbi:MAG: glycosyltransferase family 2 protein [Ruminococcus sp.]|nr:glycosyltransferase family 2 protein [Ruminococcus sp.]
MKIAAVVVTYNRIGLLQECLDAILNQERKADTVVVIDNASTDGTDKLFEQGGKYDLPCVDYQRMSENLGGAGGFYEGVRYSYSINADWIWIMDDDTIPSNNALSEFCNALKVLEKEKVSFLASSVFGPKGEPMNVPELDNRRSDNEYQDWYKYLDDGLLKIEDATFVSLLINKNAMEQVDYPYKEFFIWGDDKEYTLHLSRFYGPAYMVGKSIVTHKKVITKRISIENATDPKRIEQYYYNYRNILVNTKTYRRETAAVVKRILEFNSLCIKILKDKNQQYRWKKVATIHKGIWGYLFGGYDKKKFKDRFSRTK